MNALARWWFAPAPAQRLAALRILIGGYALVYVVGRLPEIATLSRYGASQFRPVGVVRLLDAPLPPGIAIAIATATCLLLAAFVAGAYYRISGPLAAAALLWTITYRNVWGMLFHTENLMVLHVLVLACVPAADVWSIDARRRGGEPRVASAGYGWAIKLLVLLTAATYVLAGIAKLRIAGVGWIDGELLRNQIAVDNLRKSLFGDSIAPLVHLVLDHPAPLVVFSVMTLTLELGAPLALIHRRIGYAWALGAWGFHVGVVLLMNIWFPYPLFGFAYLPLLPAEKIVARATTLVVMLRRPS
ncbi:MAG: HTTM domain-containing protein [Kofleriaceae bacterium]|nr:HTTM domain-containing protein [Kofleriaceae bacterium]